MEHGAAPTLPGRPASLCCSPFLHAGLSHVPASSEVDAHPVAGTVCALGGPSTLVSQPLWLVLPLVWHWLGVSQLCPCSWGQESLVSGDRDRPAPWCPRAQADPVLGAARVLKQPHLLWVAWATRKAALLILHQLWEPSGAHAALRLLVPTQHRVHQVPLWHRDSWGPCQHQIPRSNWACWIPQWGVLDPPGAQRVPKHLGPPSPHLRHWVTSRELRPAWLPCVIPDIAKGRAVIGCLRIILLEAGLQLVVGASPPTEADL